MRTWRRLWSVPASIAASQRGTKSAQVQRKRLSKKDRITEILVPMYDQHDAKHKRIVDMVNVTKDPMMTLNRTI